MGVEFEFGRGVRVGRDVESIGQGDAEAEIVGPSRLQVQAAVDVQDEARQVQVERNLESGAAEHAAQADHELHGVGMGRRRSTLHPVGQEVPVGVVPADQHVVDRHLAAGIIVGQDVQTRRTKDFEQRLLQRFNQLAVAAELRPQVGQQLEPRVAQEVRRRDEPVADQRKFMGQRAEERVLDRAHREPHAVDDVGGVVQQAQNGERAAVLFVLRGDVGILVAHLQVAGIGGRIRQLLEQIPEPLVAVAGASPDVEVLVQQILFAVQRQPYFEIRLEAALRLRLDVVVEILGRTVKLAVVRHPAGPLVELDRQPGTVNDRLHVAVAVQSQVPVGGEDLHRPRAEAQLQFLARQPSVQRRMRARRLVDRHGRGNQEGDFLEARHRRQRRRIGCGDLPPDEERHLDAQVRLQSRTQSQQRYLPVAKQVRRLAGTVDRGHDGGLQRLDRAARSGRGRLRRLELGQDRRVHWLRHHADPGGETGIGKAASRRRDRRVPRLAIVVEEDLRVVRSGRHPAKANPGVHPQVGRRLELDVPRAVPGVHQQSHRVHARQQAVQVQGQAVEPGKHCPEIHVNVQHLAVQGQRERLVLRVQRVVVRDPQRRFENGFQFLDRADARRRRLRQPSGKVGLEAEHLAQRPIDPRQRLGVERLVLQRLLQEIQPQLKAGGNVRRRQELEAKRRAEIRQD